MTTCKATQVVEDLEIAANREATVRALIVAARAGVSCGHGEVDERKAAFLDVASKAWDRALAEQRRRML